MRKGEATAAEFRQKCDMMDTALKKMMKFAKEGDYTHETVAHILKTMIVESEDFLEFVSQLPKTTFNAPCIKKVIDEAKEEMDNLSSDSESESAGAKGKKKAKSAPKKKATQVKKKVKK
jgi:hypothetical protein